jgi:hypothetical protein
MSPRKAPIPGFENKASIYLYSSKFVIHILGYFNKVHNNNNKKFGLNANLQLKFCTYQKKKKKKRIQLKFCYNS